MITDLRLLYNKTHNVALAAPIARFVVSLTIDGSVSGQETDINSLIQHNPALAEEFEAEREIIETTNHELVPPLADEPPNHDGKLVAKEEIMEGRVKWKSIKLFISALGGNHPVVFFSLWMASILVTDWTNTFQIWFLGYWGSQYENHDPSEVRVTL